MLEPLKIVIDSREQTPWGWEPCDAITHVRALAAGDYALDADCEEVKGRESLAVRFAIERKSLDDFLGTISREWARFQLELTKMESFPARVVIVEGNFADCCFNYDKNGILQTPQHSHARLTPRFIARRIAELTLSNVAVLFCGDAALASGLAYRILRRRHEETKA